MIDFSFPPDVDEVRLRVREFMDTRVRPEWEQIDQSERRQVVECIVKLREEARNEWQLWLPHMPEEWGGMALGPTAMAAVSAEAAKVSIGPFVLNAQAPDEGNQHTLLHWGTDEQKEKYLKPLCEGTARSCFAMTEPEVAGSDPTLIKTTAYQDGDEWVVNGHKWFISGARGAKFALLVARTEDDPEIPQAANSCFIVDLPSDGWEVVRDVQTMSGGHNHCEIRITDLRVPAANMLAPRPGHLLGQYRLGPARLAHCMRWIGQAETALDMMVSRSMERYSHGSLLAEKQGIQWLIADSAVELYQCKLMVLHAAYQIDQKMDFTQSCRWRSTLLRTVCGASSTGRFKFTGRSGIPPTRRWRTCCSKHGGHDLPMVPTRSIRCESLSAPSPFNDSGTTKAATGNLPL